MDDNEISIYTPENEWLESLRVREFVHTHVYNVNLLKKGEWMSTFPLSFTPLVEFCDEIFEKTITGGGDLMD
jgi:hypothetical protein